MIIKNATKHNAAAIAPLMLLAMEDIVYKFIGINDYLSACAFLTYFVKLEDNQYSYQNCKVVYEGQDIVAVANVYDGGDLHDLRAPIISYIRQHYDPSFDPDDETQQGEIYIDTISVSPSHQGQGIGKALLTNLIDEHVTHKRQVLGLLVEKDNHKAMDLYHRLGFVSVGNTTLVGKSLMHMQRR
jgi:ribosomal protein S18 acetylase RimI-like enzyme